MELMAFLFVLELHTAMKHFVLVALLFYTKAAHSLCVPVRVPEKLMALYGSCAEISCTFGHRKGYGTERARWLKGGGDPLGPRVSVIYDSSESQNLSTMLASSEVNFTGDLTQNKCSLRINRISKHDETIYSFRLRSRNPVGATCVSAGNVSISIIYSPTIVMTGDLIAGRPVQLTCSVPHSCPSSQLELKWVHNTSFQANIEVSNESGNATDGSAKVSATFSFIPSMANDGENLVCEISGVGVLLTAQKSQLLDIQYQPLILSGPNCTGFENWINCICKVKAKPTATVTWRINGYRTYFHVTNRTFENFVVHSSLKIIRQSGARQLISCVAANLHGTSNGTYSLETPVSGSLPRDVAIATGTGTIIVIVILIAVFAHRKMINTSSFDAHADVRSEEGLHRITEKRSSASNFSNQSEKVTYAAVNISRLPRNERHHQNEENTEYAAISFK